MVDWSPDKITHKVAVAQDSLRSLNGGDREAQQRIETILSELTLRAQFIDPQFDIFPTLLYLKMGDGPITARPLGLRPPAFVFPVPKVFEAGEEVPLRFGLNLPVSPDSLSWDARKERALHVGSRAAMMPIGLVSDIVKKGGEFVINKDEIDYWSDYIWRRT